MQSWQPADIRLDAGDIAAANGSSYPHISSFNNSVYVVWEESGNGASDIYFNIATIPLSDIKANGSDGPITITQGDPLLTTVDFGAGIEKGEDAD